MALNKDAMSVGIALRMYKGTGVGRMRGMKIEFEWR